MWAVYAMGGGWGHLTRAAALARVAPGPVRIVTNCAYASFIQQRLPDVEICMATSRGQTLAALSNCETLIVDTFPRGILGELADWLPDQRMRKVLVARDLTPEYVEEFALRDFVSAHYDLVIAAGEGEAFHGLPRTHWTDPWLALALPALQSNRTYVLICAAGNPEELGWYGEVARLLSAEMPVRCISPACPPGCPPELWQMHWPAGSLLGSAVAVIGGAGYNTVYETLAAGVPLVARPWPRIYDRQLLRAQRVGATVVTTPDQAVRAVLRLRFHRNTAAQRSFANGAGQAAALLSAS